MPKSRWQAAVLVLAVGGCGAPRTESQGKQPNEGARSRRIVYFAGSLDFADQTLEVHNSSPPGVSALTVLPYGIEPDQVFFHTCPGTVAYDLLTHQLTGTVQGVNNMTAGPVNMLTAVIDTVRPAGVTPASGVIAAYGTVNAGLPEDCGANTRTWTFTDPTDANFSFSGHAEGNRTCVPATSLCDFQNEGGTVVLECPPGMTISEITYASYGTPDGTCPGPFTTSACHSPISQQVVEDICLDENSCSVQAINEIFTDECGGTVKQLAVTANCCP